MYEGVFGVSLLMDVCLVGGVSAGRVWGHRQGTLESDDAEGGYSVTGASPTRTAYGASRLTTVHSHSSNSTDVQSPLANVGSHPATQGFGRTGVEPRWKKIPRINAGRSTTTDATSRINGTTAVATVSSDYLSIPGISRTGVSGSITV